MERGSSALNKTDLLPSANLIFKLTEAQNVASQRHAHGGASAAGASSRRSSSRTSSERARCSATPDLDRSRIWNFDALGDVSPRGRGARGERVHKRFEDPIEQVILPTSRGVISYQNAKGAVNTGVEVEGRKSLDFVSSAIRTSGSSPMSPSSALAGRPRHRANRYSDVRRAGPSPGSLHVFNVALDWNRERSRTRARISTTSPASGSAPSAAMDCRISTSSQRGILVDLSVAQAFGDLSI